MKKPEGDAVLILITAVLLLIGIAMIYSASAVIAERQYGDARLFLKKQILWIMIGLLVMVVASKIPYA